MHITWAGCEEFFFAACMLSFYLFVIALLCKGSVRVYEPPKPDATAENVPCAGEMPYDE
jgi:hypothetical protein